ncbi:MAG: Zn-dependent protease [Schlesneria sp.]|nr:Zn-dependent protease [Schlesneria sp.]
MSLSIPSEQISSSHRPVPLRGRADLIVKAIDFQGVTHYVIKDPIGLTYHRLRGDQYCILKALDGRRHIEAIRDDLVRTFPSLSPILQDIQQAIADLHQKGLVYGIRPGQAAARIGQRRKKWRQQLWGVLTNILSLRLPGWDPDRTLTRMLRWTRWMFHPATVVIASVVILGSWLLLAIQFSVFQSRLPAFSQFFGWPNLIFLWCTLAGAKIIHEFGHGLSCKYFGGECHEMGVMLLVGSPCLYCDVSDSWMLKNKWSRMLIGAAGMIIEIALSAIAIFVWWMTEPGLLHYLCLNLFFVTAATTVIFNANPLMRLDGYYILSDFLEIPNLRPKADRLLQEYIERLLLGTEPRPDPSMPQTGRHWFVLFAIASTLYGWVVLFGILTFLYTVLKPYELQSIGQTLAALSVAAIVGKLTRSTYLMITAQRAKPVKKRRLAISLTIVTVICIAIATIPVPWFGSAAFTIEPKDVQNIYTKVPGHLIELPVQAGDRVVKGQLLAILSDPILEDRVRKLNVQQKLQIKAIHLGKATDNPSSVRLAQESLRSVEEELAALVEHQRQLRIVAPCGGIIIGPQKVPSPKLEEQKLRLPQWTGTPLDPRNTGCKLDEQTHLLSIAPIDAMQAILYLDQSDRHDVSVGMKVALKLDHLPDRILRGTVSHIATAQAEYIPGALSVKYGGQLPTTTDRQGKEELQNAAYQAVVVLNESPELFRTDLRGTARFIVTSRSASGWLWRYIRRTFHFRM